MGTFNNWLGTLLLNMSKALNPWIQQKDTIMKNVLLIILLLFSALGEAQDIRNTPLPNPYVTIKQFGYSDAVSHSMISGTTEGDKLWSVAPSYPSKGWTSATFILRDRMKTALWTTGFDEPMANVIINMCKVFARDARHCITYATAVACAESACGNTAYGPNVFGNRYGTFATRTAAARNWIIEKYGVYWYTANEGYYYNFCNKSVYPYHCDVGFDYDTLMFYSDNPKKPPETRYCLDEKQSNGTIVYNYCPNGHNASKAAYLAVR